MVILKINMGLILINYQVIDLLQFLENLIIEKKKQSVLSFNIDNYPEAIQVTKSSLTRFWRQFVCTRTYILCTPTLN